MRKILVLAVVPCLLQVLLVPTAGGQAVPLRHESQRCFAAVLLVRGSVAGATVGNYGIFVRNEADSAWTRIMRSNTMAFGLGYFEHGTTRRYYLAAGNGLHRSTDGGKNWRILTSWRTEEILNVAPDPVDSAIIYVATPQGVFKTTDDGATWVRKMNGARKWFVQRILLDRADRRTLYAACEDDLYRSRDSGDNWVPLKTGAAPVLAILQHPRDDSILLVGVESGGVRCTTDGGRTWSASRGLEGNPIYSLSASADGRDLYAAGWQTGLWRSEDSGRSWEQVWPGPSVEAVYSICVDPGNSNHVLVGTAGAGVYESTDRGTTWRYAGLPGAQIRQIEFYP